MEFPEADNAAPSTRQREAKDEIAFAMRINLLSFFGKGFSRLGHATGDSDSDQISVCVQLPSIVTGAMSVPQPQSEPQSAVRQV